MADAADMADEIQAEVIDLAVRAARDAILPGISGDCEKCDWWMPRLVDGLCGFCRDGRPRPPDWEPPPRLDPVVSLIPEDIVMAKSPLPSSRKPAAEPAPAPAAFVPITPRQRMMAAIDGVAAIAAEILDQPSAEAALARVEDAEREVARLREVVALERARADAAVGKLDSLREALAA